MKEYLKTMRQQGMQQQMQQHPEDGKKEFPPVYKDDEVEKYGNADAKALANAYHELSKDGLTEKEKEQLKKFDEVLKGAHIIAPDSDIALVTQDDGYSRGETTFVLVGGQVKSKQTAANKGFKPKGF